MCGEIWSYVIVFTIFMQNPWPNERQDNPPLWRVKMASSWAQHWGYESRNNSMTLRLEKSLSSFTALLPASCFLHESRPSSVTTHAGLMFGDHHSDKIERMTFHSWKRRKKKKKVDGLTTPQHPLVQTHHCQLLSMSQQSCVGKALF